jgi:DTW domain-containing protein
MDISRVPVPLVVRMSRRDNRDLRCPRCHMLGGLCVCALIPSPPLVTRTRLVLVLHRLEERKPTNTGTLAAACLANSEIIVRGHEGEPTPPFVAPEGTRPLLLFPAEDAVPLAPSPDDRPVTLIVPDGTWRQAAKVRRRVPGMAEVPCVTLPPGPPTTYRLRSEPVEGGLATLEAIARAFDILEGRHVRDALERVFRAMVERTLWSRGELAAADVADGIPAGVTRDPRRPAS